MRAEPTGRNADDAVDECFVGEEKNPEGRRGEEEEKTRRCSWQQLCPVNTDLSVRPSVRPSKLASGVALFSSVSF